MPVVKLVIGLVLALILHFVGVNLTPSFPRYVDFFLPVAVTLALGGSSLAGLLGGLATGLTQDAASGGLLGLHGLAGTITGYAVARLSQRLVLRRSTSVFGIGVIASLVHQGVLFGTAAILLPHAAEVEAWSIPVRALSVGAISMLVHVLGRRYLVFTENRQRNRMGRLRMP
jgi:rod shape-determining protein MreD